MVRKLRYSFVALLVVFLFANSISAATIRSFDITYTVDQTSARDMLAMVNDFRENGEGWYWDSTNTTKIQTGSLPALKYDYTLEKIALQRAYEIAISFSHTRPDGSGCFSLKINKVQSYGENIAAGNSSTSATFNQWKEENKKYGGQGHRRIMLGEGYTSIGIAHVVLNGSHFWVQEFGYENSGAAQTTALMGTVTGTVGVDISSATFAISTVSPYTSLNPYETRVLPELVGSYKFKDTYGTRGAEVPSDELTGITWKSSNPSALTIVNNKSVKAVGPGNSTLTATVNHGGQTYTTTMSVSVKTVSLNNTAVTATAPSCTYDVNGATPKPTIKYSGKTLVENTDYTIDSYHNTTFLGDVAYITVIGKGNFTGTRYINYEITAADISTCTISSIPASTYTGSAITPEVTVKQNDTALKKNTHYTVTYSNNTSAGTASVTIAGKGNFTGSVTRNFKIAPKSITGVTVSSISKQTYTGSAITPALTVKDGTVALKSGTDYTVSYSNNTAVGTATATITGKGNYQGTKSVNFSIAEPVYTWKAVSGKWYLYDDAGHKYTGFMTVSGETYYLDSTGAMQTGWQSINGTWYYFKSTGAMAKVWEKINGKWYYFKDSGEMVTGWLKSGGVWYYFDSEGAMTTGWKQVDGKWYYFNEDGNMITGWKFNNGDYYYLSSDGAMVTGWKGINNSWYYFDGEGRMVTGWKQISGDWYYFGPSGAMKTGWIYSGGYWYYLQSDGSMAYSKSLTIEGKVYNFDKDGICTNP